MATWAKMHVPNLKMQRILQSHKNTALTLEYSPLKTCRSTHLQQIKSKYLEISPKSPLPEPLISFLLHQPGNFCAGHVSCHEDLSAVQQLTIFQQYKFITLSQAQKSPRHVNLMCEVTRSTILGEVINTRCRAVVGKLGGLFFKAHVVRENGDIVTLVEAENSPLSYPIVAMLPRPSPPVRRTGLKAVTNFHQAGWTGSLAPLFIHFVSNQ